MKSTMKMRTSASLVITFCLLVVPMSVFAKKGDAHYKKGLQYEAAQQWEKAAQEFTLAVAADPANTEYQLHFRRASFNASQAYMQQGRALAEQRDYVGAYNAFRQAYGYDPVNQVAVSEMERMLRLQAVKEGVAPPVTSKEEDTGTPFNGQAQEPGALPSHVEQVRLISYSGDLKQFIRSLADQLDLNVVFDKTSFAQPRVIDLNLKQVTTAQALDYVFLQEGLFFQKLSKRTILVADQTRRAQYQQLVVRTFYLSNTDPDTASQLIGRAIPPSVGRPQTIVVPDKATNSLTVRDTAENVRLIGDLLQSIDKDRAEVVMDVNIYEVTKSDLIQIGNQLGQGSFNLGGSPGLSVLTSNGTLSAARTGVNLASIVGGVPTGAAAALVIPPSVLTAFQSKNNAKLIASTQVHAFNNEESTARIGQRVPVQTASVYGYSQPTTTTNQASNVNNGVFGSNGYPVINYEPTGLTLKFTPLVFPNYDVQVKMSIESKDVTGSNTLTPTFTERTITGTARVQNNRTMMLASVSQDIQSAGRAGLPVLGGLPLLGRLFTSPTRENRQVDIVIAVTPRVLRAPAVTPRDEEMRPSGTLSNPTTGTIASVIIDAEREERIAAAREEQRTKPSLVVPADVAQVKAQIAAPLNVVTTSLPAVSVNNQTAAGAPTAGPTVASNPGLSPLAQVQSAKVQIAEDPPAVPAPKSMINSSAAAEVAAINTGTGGSANATLTSLAKPIDVSAKSPVSRTAELKLTTPAGLLKAGDKWRVAVELNSETPIAFAVLSLRFNPRVISIRGVSMGTLLTSQDAAPSFNPSVDPAGSCLISIAALNGVPPMKGTGALVFIDLEIVADGKAGLAFDREKSSLVATDARELVLALTPALGTVKQ